MVQAARAPSICTRIEGLIHEGIHLDVANPANNNDRFEIKIKAKREGIYE